jgi:hypothetical protein
LTDFARNAVVERTIADLKRSLVSDQGLANKLIQLHKLAVRSGFPDEYRARIVAASLERARKLIPTIRNKHVMSALGKRPSKGNDKIRVANESGKVTTASESRGTTTSGSKIDMHKTSEIDFLNDKITFKK